MFLVILSAKTPLVPGKLFLGVPAIIFGIVVLEAIDTMFLMSPIERAFWCGAGDMIFYLLLLLFLGVIIKEAFPNYYYY